MANEMYLVCQHCEENGALRLGKRVRSKYITSKKLDLDGFFKLHEGCGNGPDHFALAHQFPLNHDVATFVDGAVHQALQ